MDPAGLTVLIAELQADCVVAGDAARKASARMTEEGSGHLEACAYELSRFYNVVENMLERICEGFENHFEKRGDYHEKLLQRLRLSLPGIRPAFIPAGRMAELRQLKAFRHLARHAYDLTLRADRLSELTDIAARAAADLPQWCAGFAERVRLEQGWL